ncbi:uncharacterized protein LOC120353582 [Nilaparvata lugens]|uniref:uncharacterized protein LOC120353582 n=1 Tax=Nilaparvata lugens TaxID=108931 RepID=UPI00193E565F|nr:uncharacterized protein LOC120353582 [Nilaparvata lugens]
MAKPKKTRPSNSLMDYKGLKAPKKRRQNINNNKDEDDSVDSDDSGSNYIIDTSKWRRSALKNRPNMSGEHPVATTYTSTADNPVTSRIENTSSPRDQRTTHPVSGSCKRKIPRERIIHRQPLQPEASNGNTSRSFDEEAALALIAFSEATFN